MKNRSKKACFLSVIHVALIEIAANFRGLDFCFAL